MWRRVSGAFKDENSLIKARLTSRRSTFWNPDIQKAVIKATNHDESYVDIHHTQCVYAWINKSEEYLRPVLWALSVRMERTHNWVVALKGLMLMHGVFCCKVPAVQTIGRLPFDLTDFKHGHSGNVKRWSFEAFIRDYYAFLDQKSAFLYLLSQQQKDNQERSEKSLILQDLVWLQKLQPLLDMLLQIKPRYAASTNLLVLEAMECIVAESFDIYGHICNRIVSILGRIYSTSITEAKITLFIIEKATDQQKQLSKYLDFCRNIGVVKASERPKVEHISRADIQNLENLIKSGSNQSGNKQFLPKEEQKYVIMEEKTTTETHESNDSRSGLRTTITTDEWEVFEDDELQSDQQLELISLDSPMETRNNNTNPFGYCNTHELPDLISF
ncbi:putative clathrin assembly protein At1g25240 [Cynara cardunculus var. scolymus]|uniref:ENTH domain-containing protein n=1 Tax=Cynara cardunculus var. scolymus TaxID=59895 RepID=A0A118JXU0_CYNCS|nr:putative clathrin assembly protein At1g25240 [Cynara cardunculus var. scolymus]KVH97511.1 hypothetical protein Ccrd_000405 [Cynara cardunculus var. scolymus]